MKKNEEKKTLHSKPTSQEELMRRAEDFLKKKGSEGIDKDQFEENLKQILKSDSPKPNKK